MDKISKIMRWLMVLPCAIAGGVLSFTAIIALQFLWDFVTPNHTYDLGIMEIGEHHEWSFFGFGVFIFSHILLGICFISAGVYVAPSHKKATATVLLILMSIALIVLSILSICRDTYTMPIGAFISIGAALMQAKGISNDIG